MNTIDAIASTRPSPLSSAYAVRPNSIKCRGLAIFGFALIAILGIGPETSARQAYAVGVNVHGCTISNIPNNAKARACIDAGFVLSCAISGNYCCEQTDSGGLAHCHSVDGMAGMSTPQITLPTQNELPPPSLVTPIYGASTITAPKGVGLPQ